VSQPTPHAGPRSPAEPAGPAGVPAELDPRAVLELVRRVTVETVFAAGSLVEGFRHAESDLDIYIFQTDAAFRQTFPGRDRVPWDEQDYLGERRVHLEYWTVERLEKAVEKLGGATFEDPLAGQYISFDELKFLNNVSIGRPLREPDRFRELAGAIDRRRLAAALHAKYYGAYFGAAEDTSGLLRVGDARTAALTVQQCLDAAVDCLIARMGNTNPQGKWRIHKLDRLGEHELVRRYWACRTAPQGDDVLHEYCERCLRLAQELVLRAETHDA